MKNYEISDFSGSHGPMHFFGEVDESTRRLETSPYLTLSQDAGISFKYEDGKNLILLERDVAYPEREEGKELSKLLLPGEKGRYGGQYLELPENYVTMAQALNDAIGDNASDRSKEMMRGLFMELGESLGRVARGDRQVPREFSYKNVIFSRDEIGPKLLPPVEFISFDPNQGNSAVAQQHVIDSLYASLQKGAANSTQQRNVADVFGGFIKAFGW